MCSKHAMATYIVKECNRRHLCVETFCLKVNDSAELIFRWSCDYSRKQRKINIQNIENLKFLFFCKNSKLERIKKLSDEVTSKLKNANYYFCLRILNGVECTRKIYLLIRIKFQNKKIYINGQLIQSVMSVNFLIV